MKVRKRKNKTSITYRGLLIWPELAKEIAETKYFMDGWEMQKVRVNQCPICFITNINMDDWKLTCLGAGEYDYIYKRPVNKNHQRKDHERSHEHSIKYIQTKKRDSHEPVEMKQEILNKKDVKKFLKEFS